MSTFHIKVSKDERVSILISIGLVVVGYLSSVTNCNPGIFARFGSLLVCTGVIFSLKGLPQTLDAVQPIYEREIKNLRDAIESLCTGHKFEEGIRAEMSRKLEPEITALEQKMKRTIFALKKRLLHTEGTIVIVGTLIWGFGDYLVPCIYQLCPK